MTHFTCRVCPATGPDEDTAAAQARAEHHVYAEHPALWRTVIGDRPPRSPKPPDPPTPPVIHLPPAIRKDRP